MLKESDYMPYTYMLKCSDNTIYVGWTVDLKARLKAHNDGTGARYTRGRLPAQLVYWEEQEDRSSALKREATIRRLTRKQKEALIASINNRI